MEKRPFAELGLSPETLKAVAKLGFEEASPIQTAVIPVALAGRDVVGQSSTGSGKTAAFAIPALERVETKVRGVQVLVLCPTRELAVQVAEETGKLALFKRGVLTVPIYGGQSYERQFRALAAGAQVVIGTPGRVMDLMKRGTLRLDALKIVVLDETDRMLDMGFRDDIELILKSVPATRQLLFFSATIPRQIQDLIGRYSKDPAWIRIAEVAQNAPQVEQVYFEVERRSKIEALARLIDVNDFRYGIIFCSTKVMVDDLDGHLHSRGYQTDRLHGDITQAQRDRVMEKFRRRGFEFLVATDVAARGLDVDDLEVVFNFDLPNDAEDYTHRIGRTGRAGRKGQAFTFVSGQELYKLQSMVRWAKLNIRRGKIPSLDEVEEARTNVFFERLRATLDAREFKAHERMVDRLLDQGYASTDICSALIHLLQQGGGPGGPPSAVGPVSTKPSTTTAPHKAATPHAARGTIPGPAASTVAAPVPATPAELGTPSTAGPSAAPSAERATLPTSPTPPTPRPPSPKPSSPKPSSHAAPRPRSAPAPLPSHRRPEPGIEDRESVPPARAAVPSTPYPAPEKPGRTGRERGMKTLFLNVGRKHLVTPADIVGKIAGVTRLPAEAVGAVDIHQRHSLADVAEDQAEFIAVKLTGIRLKGVVLSPTLAVPSTGGSAG